MKESIRIILYTLLQCFFVSIGNSYAFYQHEDVIGNKFVDIEDFLPVSKSRNSIKGAIYANPEKNPSERALDLMRYMTFDEKLNMSGGYMNFMLPPLDRLGIRPLFMADASQGIRLNTAPIKDRSTSFPCMLALASTWNKDLAFEFGCGIGTESRALGVDILLGPGINMQRLSVGGRNYEYMGEDPYLTGVMATQYVLGVQSKGVMATPKHFICNDQEFCRHISSSNVDERTMREIYLLPWEMVIKRGHAMAMMTGNNLVNNVPAVMNRDLVMNVIRREYGFRGISMSDWQNSSYHPEIQHLLPASGQTLLMANNETFCEWVKKEIHKSEERKNEIELMLESMIYPNIYAGFAMGSYDRLSYDKTMFGKFDLHKQIARLTAEEAIVMLKNEDSVLPVSTSKKILLMGGDEIHSGLGSGFVAGYDHTSFEDGLRRIFQDNFKCEEFPSDNDIKEADVILFRINKQAGEEHDVPFDEPVEQLKELSRVTRLNKNVIVILSSCNPMPMDWISDVKGVLWTYYLGQERGNALADIIIGKSNPSGKLPFTIERKFKDSPSPEFNFLGGKPYWVGATKEYKDYWLNRSNTGVEGLSEYIKPGEVIPVDYKEGIFVGYRWFDKNDISVVYPFGYGLSYTDFEYSDLAVEDRYSTDGKVYVSVSIKNTGKVSGKEVIQLYIKDDECSVERPEKELKGYEKIYLRPGEKKTVTIELDSRSFAFWDVDSHSWKVESGLYTIMVGASSRDILLESKLSIKNPCVFTE